MTSRLALVDTSAFIEADRRPGSPTAGAVVAALDDGRAAVCHVVAAELLTGCRSQSEYREMDLMLSGLAWLPVTDECWARVAALGFNLRRAGITVPLPDRLVAVTARVHAVDLLHCDSHFDMIGDTPDMLQ